MEIVFFSGCLSIDVPGMVCMHPDTCLAVRWVCLGVYVNFSCPSDMAVFVRFCFECDASPFAHNKSHFFFCKGLVQKKVGSRIVMKRR